MVKTLALLVILAGFAYLVNYFFNNSVEVAAINGAFREMSQKSCKEVSEALVGEPGSENRTKADIYLAQLAEPRFNLPRMKENYPDEWSRLVSQFQTICYGNPGLPGSEVFQRIPRVAVMGQNG